MYSLDDLKLFVRTAKLENLSAAARELGRTAATASAALIRLEQRLSARLLARTTRRMRLTEEGRVFLEAARKALAALEEGEGALAEQREELAGPLRLSAPADLGRALLRGWLIEFLQARFAAFDADYPFPGEPRQCTLASWLLIDGKLAAGKHGPFACAAAGSPRGVRDPGQQQG